MTYELFNQCRFYRTGLWPGTQAGPTPRAFGPAVLLSSPSCDDKPPDRVPREKGSQRPVFRGALPQCDGRIPSRSRSHRPAFPPLAIWPPSSHATQRLHDTRMIALRTHRAEQRIELSLVHASIQTTERYEKSKPPENVCKTCKTPATVDLLHLFHIVSGCFENRSLTRLK